MVVIASVTNSDTGQIRPIGPKRDPMPGNLQCPRSLLAVMLTPRQDVWRISSRRICAPRASQPRTSVLVCRSVQDRALRCLVCSAANLNTLGRINHAKSHSGHRRGGRDTIEQRAGGSTCHLSPKESSSHLCTSMMWPVRLGFTRRSSGFALSAISESAAAQCKPATARSSLLFKKGSLYVGQPVY